MENRPTQRDKGSKCESPIVSLITLIARVIYMFFFLISKANHLQNMTFLHGGDLIVTVTLVFDIQTKTKRLFLEYQKQVISQHDSF